VPQELALGAIVPSPRGMQLRPWYWPRSSSRSSHAVTSSPDGLLTYRPHYRGGARRTLSNIKSLALEPAIRRCRCT
jgi:hypothetical protein